MPLELKLPRKAGLFITATDTGVGKTLISGGISRILADQGLKVAPFKPIASGCRHEREGLINSDAEFLAYCSRCDFPISTINPIAYSIPAATVVCEKYEHRMVDFDLIARQYQHLCENSDIAIVEGIGGIKVPISAGVDVLDLAKCFKLPTVIVARPDLGTINHTLLTIDSLRNAGVKIAGVVINGYNADNADLAVEEAPEIIADCGKVEILTIVPFDKNADTEKASIPDSTTEALSAVDWKAVAGL